jgi:hypothetical protein
VADAVIEARHSKAFWLGAPGVHPLERPRHQAPQDGLGYGCWGCYRGKASGQAVLEGWLSHYDAPQVALRAFAMPPACN